MISNKKSYAMKMLQLALALSLLHVDPDNFLQQRLRSWDSQLELRDGDGWELEMLRAVPMVEYPYANRKTMMPLIEDLVRFDRELHSSPHNQYNVTAYHLNVHNNSTDQTAAVQELQATSASTAPATPTAAAGAVALEQAASAVVSAANTNSSNLRGISSPELELFLNSEHFQDQRSIWEQNLADLEDFGDLTVMNPYSGLPKDEPLDSVYFDIQFEAALPGLAAVANAQEVEGAVAPNDTFPNPSDGPSIKVERLDKEEDACEDNVASCSTAAAATVIVKKEPEDATEESASEAEPDLSPFISDVILTKEESEIVEVLWKQDVDLGYSLTPPQLTNSASGAGKALACNSSDDDIEKLKALEELNDDKTKYDPKDEDDNDVWAGIPFTVDNETGEYIRLPLDELLNDVLRLADFGSDSEDANSDSIASTSQAAAANVVVLNKLKSEGDDNNENDEDGDDNKENSNINSNSNNNGNNNYKSEGELTNDDDLPQTEIEVGSLPSPLFDLDDEAKEELADLEIMIQSAASPFHHHHHHHPHRPTAATAGVQNAYATVGGGANSAFHRQASTAGYHHGHHQGRMPLSRTVSMEQRLQDIASLFNPIPSMGVVGGVSDMPPYSHYPTHHYAYQSAAGIPAPPQHGQYPPPPPHHHGHHAMLHANASLGDICSAQPHYGHNLGSAVSSSMHLTNASHEADAGAAAAAGAGNVGAYKMEHDMMYYSNASSDMNHTTDGFINSILNDEDLHLMDMNVNDSFCRMVDVNNSTSNNSSVLGLSSSHASAGSIGNGGTGATSNGGGGPGALGMSSGAVGATAGGAGMTADLMNAAGAQGGDRLDASSDSAVSSMGSERVPSLSDGEWGEGSDSAQDYHQGKYGGPYDYSYNNTSSSNRLNDGSRQPPVAQKKHQMFGKRFLHEQPGGAAGAAGTAAGAIAPTGNGLLHGPAQSIKYEYEPYPALSGLHHNQHVGGGVLGEGAMGPMLLKEHQAYTDVKYEPGAVGGGGYSLDFSLRTPRTSHDIVQHNHTYTLPQGTGSLPRPQQRDKKTSTSSSRSSKSSSGGFSEEEHLTRDEKRARALSIPITVSEIINLPMDEFNERLSKHDLTENQLSLIRDIRRRGKNKVAAQNCRKRKLDQILSLEDEVKEVRRRKDHLLQDRDTFETERKRISNKFAMLHRHIFQYLRDPEGNPCSPSEYSLQQAADGSIYLLPRDIGNKTDAATGIASASGGSNVSQHLSHAAASLPPQQQHTQQQIAAGTHLNPHQQQHQHALAPLQPHTHHSAQQTHTHQQQQQQNPHAHHQQTHQKD